MPINERPISHPEQFVKNINASKNGIVLEGDVIWYKKPGSEDREQIANYKDGKISSEFSLDEKADIFKQLSEMDRRPDRLMMDDDDKARFEDIFKGQNANYRLTDGKIFPKGSDKEICEYSDGKFTLTKPDGASMQALVDMLHEGGVQRVTVLPKNSPDGLRLQAMFLEKGIEVDNISPAEKRPARFDQRRSLSEQVANNLSPDRTSSSNRDRAMRYQSSKTFDEAIDDIKGGDFNRKFQLYDDPNDVRPNAPFKMYRTSRITRSYSGKEAGGHFSALMNDKLRERRIKNGAAFEVDRNTLEINPLSEKRSAIKGMIKFAIAAGTDENLKLKFTAKSEKAAKRYAQEAMKQGLSLDQIEIDIADANGRIVQENFKLSLFSEMRTRDHMKKGTLTNPDEEKYAKQLAELKVKSPEVGLIKGADNVVRSRFDVPRTTNTRSR